MKFVNHYSAPILWALLVAGGISVVMRRKRKLRDWAILGVAAVAIGIVGWSFRPEAVLTASMPNVATLVEIQSPYCLGCLAQKPSVDRIEREFAGKLVVRRVDVQSAEGEKLTKQYGVARTPTFIFLDEKGQEEWRSGGKIDADHLRDSLKGASK